MCWLCEQSDDGSQQSCPDCGRLICFDDGAGEDDICAPAYITASDDLYCSRCGSAHDSAKEDFFEDDDRDEIDDIPEELRDNDTRKAGEE